MKIVIKLYEIKNEGSNLSSSRRKVGFKMVEAIIGPKQNEDLRERMGTKSVTDKTELEIMFGWNGKESYTKINV
jgi:hypothetical protein